MNRNAPFAVMFAVMLAGAAFLFWRFGDDALVLAVPWALLCMVVAILLASRARFAGREYEDEEG